MFGYIRPLKSELKVKDFEKFKACYCSLCHVLGKEYGLAARLILNFDFTFMTMLLWGRDEQPCYSGKRCMVSPFHKKCVCSGSDSLSISAGYSVILAWWKLKDSVQDDPFFKATGARLGMLFLRRAYKRAVRKYPEFDSEVKEQLERLSAFEKEKCPSIDRASDCFALLLETAAMKTDSDLERIYRQIFYHVGRWIYIVDAVNDIREDIEHKNYNPVLVRYGVTDKLDDEQKESLKTTLSHSLNLIISAYGLLPQNTWSDIIENIIYLGMPQVCDAVFDGSFKNIREGLPR